MVVDMLLSAERQSRRHDLGPKWHKEYSEIDQHCGRVLIIDFVKQGRLLDVHLLEMITIGC